MKSKTFFLLFALLGSHCLGAQNAEPPVRPAGFSVWSQRMDMSLYAGKKYRLSMAIRVQKQGDESFAVAFIRNEPPAGGLRAWTYMDNMMDRPVRDTSWNTYTIEYKVDPKSPWICFGMLGFGSGVFYYDALQILIETNPGEWTPVPVANSDFESENIHPWEQTSQGVPARVLGAKASADTYRPFEGKRCFKIENLFLK